MDNWFDNSISESIWRTRYRSSRDTTIEDTWRRVASSLAEVEPNAKKWQARFLDALFGFKFVPGGRVLAGAGMGDGVTLVNCFVAESPRAEIADEIRHIETIVRTLEFGGGVGCDFSSVDSAAGPGVVAYLELWDAATAMVAAGRSRRGALLGTLRIDHPDIQAFVAAKDDPRALSHFNLSVLVPRSFMPTVDRGGRVTLVNGGGRAIGSIEAGELLAQISRSAWRHGEPGMLFVDRINAENNLWYAEQIRAANPCGEVPLPPHGSCVLGSVNLTTLVRDAFTERVSFAFDELCELTAVGVRMLDNVIDTTRFPLATQQVYARDTRRIGLGVMGLADVLALLGLGYGSAEAITFSRQVMQSIAETAYATSIELAAEKGSFPKLDAARFLESGFARRLSRATRRSITTTGIRNSHLIAIAPTGTISLLANNVSSGIEPIFALQMKRSIAGREGRSSNVVLADYAYHRWQSAGADQATRPLFAPSATLSPGDHIAMQSAIQPFVDNAIAKTINLPANCTVDEVGNIFREADRAGLKGCTVFRSAGMRCPVIEPVVHV